MYDKIKKLHWIRKKFFSAFIHILFNGLREIGGAKQGKI